MGCVAGNVTTFESENSSVCSTPSPRTSNTAHSSHQPTPPRAPVQNLRSNHDALIHEMHAKHQVLFKGVNRAQTVPLAKSYKHWVSSHCFKKGMACFELVCLSLKVYKSPTFTNAIGGFSFFLSEMKLLKSGNCLT